MSLERLLVDLVGDQSVHHGGNVVDLLAITLLQKLPVTVGIFHGNGITHGELHEKLIEPELALSTEMFELSQRNRLGTRTLDNFFDAERAILCFPALNELFC